MSNFSKALSLAGVCSILALTVRASLADPAGSLADQVRDSENAFAKTMADRDFAAFGQYVADEAVFFGGEQPARGKAEVLAAWKPLYERPEAPFSWKSETVEVLASGTLAHSSGPVLDKKGQRVATFNSIWRREPDGHWRVVFDKGCDACSCRPAS